VRMGRAVEAGQGAMASSPKASAARGLRGLRVFGGFALTRGVPRAFPLAFVVVASCSGGGGTTITVTQNTPVTTVAVTPGSVQLSWGETQQFTADPRAASGQSLTNRVVDWASSNAAIATVSAAGLARAVGIGTASVTATSEGKTGTSTITVGVTDPAVRSISAGATNACALTSAGAAYCWGRWGTDTVRTPTLLAGGKVFTSLALGAGRGCGLVSGGDVYCWTDHRGSTAPALANSGRPFVRIVAGDQHYCGLTSAGAAYCWGDNSKGQLGDGSSTARAAPVAVNGGLTFTSIAAGGSNSCGVTSAGAAHCWGANDNGQVGDGGGGSSRSTPRQVGGSFTYAAIAIGTTYACALTATGDPVCWGQVQPGSATSLTPATITGGPFVRLSGAGTNACGVLASGSIQCWGTNPDGRIGDGTTNARTVPTAVSAGAVFIGVAIGGSFSCGLTTAGGVSCWGANDSGQIGDATTLNRLVPTATSTSVVFRTP
jgi:alpha-tubulin suppressor-like RCC1 family protein